MLTWIINLVKWNAGHTKYKFDENALGGHRIMNHALIARSQDYDALEDGEGGGIHNTDDDQHRTSNTYGLMIGNPKHNTNSNNLNSNKLNRNGLSNNKRSTPAGG